jgi:hypothetical protein
LIPYFEAYTSGTSAGNQFSVTVKPLA